MKTRFAFLLAALISFHTFHAAAASKSASATPMPVEDDKIKKIEQTISLVTGVITTPPDPLIDNITNPLPDDFNSAGTINGQIQVNGVARP